MKELRKRVNGLIAILLAVCMSFVLAVWFCLCSFRTVLRSNIYVCVAY